ncbi:MAG: MCP four helix bundle domain-containing protein [Deltaproteobacteria bacterium]|nr:MCP four helix bundle domain-containing protein [Deltaproteobacteria bacterium]
MWRGINLRIRIYLILACLVAITMGGGGVMVWYTYRMQHLLSHIVDKNVATFRAALTLENALANQKGFLTYFLLDGDPDWLRQLGEYRQIFRQRLEHIRRLVTAPEEKAALDIIESEYDDYIRIKDQVITNYRTGNHPPAARLHKEVRDRFFSLLNRCEQFNNLALQKMSEVRSRSRAEAGELRVIAVAVMGVALLLGIALAFVLVNQILRPLRMLASETRPEGVLDESNNEVKALTQSVRGLMEDADQTQVALARSRENLLQAEKMALVGKLAAGMAHSIRNPLTSVKMRLFSMGRGRTLSKRQEEDFSVISEEIRHIDTLVENFLEFSRPPKLKIQAINPSMVVDRALQLLHHRIKSFGVTIQTESKGLIPDIQGDIEQLTEVLVNLVVNACEAMEGDGSILIRQEVVEGEDGPVMRIEVSDTGPGIPEPLLSKVFEPFFTTKEEGTGLGLSIVRRIVEEHGGSLEVHSGEGGGATFTIILPVDPGTPEPVF